MTTGTVLYVVFFEIIPKGKVVGGTGKQHIAAMILGFAIFLPSLYFRKRIILVLLSVKFLKYVFSDDDHHHDEHESLTTTTRLQTLELHH